MRINTINAEHYLWGERCDGWHLLKRDDVSVIQEKVPPGGREIPHYHTLSRQFFYILKGQALLVVNQQRLLLKAGDGVEIAPRTPHQFINESNDEAEFLVISVPKSHGDRVQLPVE